MGRVAHHVTGIPVAAEYLAEHLDQIVGGDLPGAQGPLDRDHTEEFIPVWENSLWVLPNA